MSFLDRFRPNRQKSVLPQEVQQYYQTEQRQRRGVAFALALAALLLTIGIASILFFGGRFVVDKLNGDDDKGKTAQQADNNKEKSQANTDNSKNNQNSNSKSSTPAQNTPQTPANNPQPAPATNATPNLGDEPAPAPGLPHTGDPGM